MSTKPAILVAMSSDAFGRVMSDAARQRLAEMGSVVMCLDGRALPDGEYNSLWAEADYCLSGWGVRAPDPDRLGERPRLKAICHSAGSVRMFPRKLIERGVIITSARSAIARTVAEFALTCALHLLRNMGSFYRRDRGKPVSATLYDKTVALIGCGCVGRHFRELIRPFGCRVLVVDPFMTASAAADLDVALVPLEAALSQARVVSVHAPDIPETRGMLGRPELARMADGSVLINTARGRIVDTAALTDELATGRISAALDVTDPEPLPADHPLRTFPNVLLTPHVAGPTTDDLPRLGDAAIDELTRIIRGEPPLSRISLDDYDRMSF